MKFGIHKPSLKGRISARTSVKRYIRHSLGVKAPKGVGLITNPKKAIYNHLYNRTTIGVDDLLKPSKKATDVSPSQNTEDIGNPKKETQLVKVSTGLSFFAGCILLIMVFTPSFLLTTFVWAILGISWSNYWAIAPLLSIPCAAWLFQKLVQSTKKCP